MGLIKNIKNRVARSKLSDRISKKEVKRDFVNWEKIRSVGVVCNMSVFNSEKEIASIQEAFRRNNKEAEILILSSLPLKKWKWQPTHFPYLSKEHLSWAGIPKDDITIDFLHKELDTIFVIDFQNSFLSEWIATLSRGKTLIAPTHPENRWATFMIDVAENDIKTFVEQAVHYLKVINSNQ